MAMTEDVLVWPKLAALAECLCGEIADSGLPEPCFCGIQPGAQVAYDYVDNCGSGASAKCGMAWVRLVTVYPTINWPVPAIGATPCGSDWGFTAEVGIVRCLGVDRNGKAPSAEDLLAATQLQLADMAAMQRAILCCYPGDKILGGYTPIGPNGAAVGGSWTATFPCTMI